MVEPERVLHSVMVIAFERKGKIDPSLKIIKAVQAELNLGEDEKMDALEHIEKFRGDGDWSGKKDAILSVAISRINEAIDNELISSSSIIDAITKLINVTIDEQKSSDDPLAAFEEDEEGEIQDTTLKFGLDEEDEEEEEEEVPVELVEEEEDQALEDIGGHILVEASGINSEDGEVEEVDDEEIDPFDLIGGRGESSTDNGNTGYKDPLEELMDEVEDDDGLIGTIELEGDNEFQMDSSEPESKTESVTSESQIIEMYRMMLDTVWVDDVIDPSEVALLARKRKELDISFETHMELVREMLEDSN